MAWLTTYTADNLIVDAECVRTDFLSIPGGYSGGPLSRTFSRTVTETKYRYTSMTKDAAIAGAAALQASTPTGTQRTANARRQNDTDAWFIEMFDITGTAYVEV